jgi:hypothetical protein
MGIRSLSPETTCLKEESERRRGYLFVGIYVALYDRTLGPSASLTLAEGSVSLLTAWT